MILTGYQFIVKSIAAQRPTLKNVWNDVFPTNEPKPGSLIEISGAPGTGKRILLYELMARTSLSEFFGGRYSQVIFVDLCHKLDLRFYTKYIQKAMSDNVLVCSQRTFDKAASYCQAVIHLPCYSADEFEIAFNNIENLLWDHKQISLLAIDGIDSFYWEECHHQLQSMTTHYKKLIQRLKPFCQEHNICCAYTVDTNTLQAKSKPSLFFPHSLIDYKLKFVKDSNGCRFLNDSPIGIDNGGIEFLSNKKVTFL